MCVELTSEKVVTMTNTNKVVKEIQVFIEKPIEMTNTIEKIKEM
jgi:hypothetical protein